MSRFKSLVVIVSFFLLPSLLHAQLWRGYVSGTGADTNPCTRQAPCATFAGAYAKTAVGGQIVALDAGGFQPLTITHAITVDGGGQFAGVMVNSGNAFSITAGASDTVVLRNLSIDGFNQTGNAGIDFTGAGNLIVENCTIHDFARWGIAFSPSSASSSLVVRNSSSNSNGYFGVLVGYGSAVLDNVHVNYNGLGGLYTLAHADVRNSVAEGNGVGFSAVETGDLSLVHSAAVNNSTGVVSGNVVRLSDVLISHNGTALSVGAGANAYSYGDNEVGGNTNNSFTVTPVSKQ